MPLWRRFSVGGNGMMDVSRRGFFQRASGATVISICAIAAPAVLGQRPQKVSQDELTEAVINHRAWLEDQGKGRRAVFNNRDLSGLNFTSGDGSMVNLRGADFTGSDMTGITGKDVSFLRASLHDARLSWSRFELVTFSNASLRRSKCDNVVWGWDAASQQSPSPVDPANASGFQYTDAGHADFSRAKIRGFFHETSFTAAKLIEADFSYSHFCGNGFSQTSFHGANLSSAKFNFANLSYVNFSSAICTQTDFNNSQVGYRARFAKTSFLA
jgi:uncharacterized protein YjbI with pentapeptide repeats